MALFVLSLCPFDISIGVGAFVIGLSQISSFFTKSDLKWWIHLSRSLYSYSISFVTPLFMGSVLLYLRSPRGGCCSISDDLSCSVNNLRDEIHNFSQIKCSIIQIYFIRGDIQGKPISPARPSGNFTFAEKGTSRYRQITNTKLQDEGDTIRLTTIFRKAHFLLV